MKQSIAVAVIGLLVLAGSAVEAKPGEISVGVGASVWQSNFPAADPGAGIFSIQGSGQLNGEFTIAERDGIEIGLRATDRTDGLLIGTRKGNKGAYVAPRGFEANGTRAEWNYDIHVDLRDSGTTLGDYELTFSQTFAPMLGGVAGPIDLTGGGLFLPAHTVLFQTSQNPLFGNDTFDPNKEGTYNLKLTLKPKRGGKPLSVQIQVSVR